MKLSLSVLLLLAGLLGLTLANTIQDQEAKIKAQLEVAPPNKHTESLVQKLIDTLDNSTGAAIATSSSSSTPSSVNQESAISTQSTQTPKKQICPMGTIPIVNGRHSCYTYSCSDKKDCEILFGTNTTCDLWRHRCTCDKDHQVEPQSQKCTLKKDPFPSCFQDSDCPTDNSECNQSKLQCECQFGYSKSGGKCVQFTCGNDLVNGDSQCQAAFGAHTRCRYGSCECDQNYQVDSWTKQCKSGKTKLNSTCFSDYECGANAYCINSHCACAVGFVPKTAEGDQVNCKDFTCTFNYDCYSRFNHSVCQSGDCLCDYANGYKMDSGKCIAKAKKIGEFCVTDMDCGSSASCVYSQCKCDFGSVKKTGNPVDCSPINCDSDSDCWSADFNSKCDTIINSCTCEDGYYQSYASQSCTRSYDYYYPAATIATSVVALSVLSIVLYIIAMVLRRSSSTSGTRAARRGRIVRPAGAPPAYTTAAATVKVSLPVSAEKAPIS